MFKNKEMVVLLVDDNIKNLQVLGNMLREDEYKIIVSQSGKDTLEILKKVTPDMIILDIIMPEMDGFEVCEKIKMMKGKENISIIFISALDDEKSIVKGFELGGVDYITKPFKKNEVKARVKAHLTLNFQNRQLIDLEKKNTALALAVTANHELNQPLTVVRGNLDLIELHLNDKPVDDKLNNYINEIHSSVDTMVNILDKYKKATKVNFQDYVNLTEMAILE